MNLYPMCDEPFDFIDEPFDILDDEPFLSYDTSFQRMYLALYMRL